ncbi:hypothetical protein [Streptomyces sp. NPDC055006]
MTGPTPDNRIERYVTALRNADMYALIKRRDDFVRFAEAVIAVANEESDPVYSSGYTTGRMHAGAEADTARVYRASHDSIVMGLYTTAAAAREHCTAEVRREHSDTSTVNLWWREDEDTVDQPEDGEAELIEHVVPHGFDRGITRPTGYIVTPLEVASAYDEKGDE